MTDGNFPLENLRMFQETWGFFVCFIPPMLCPVLADFWERPLYWSSYFLAGSDPFCIDTGDPRQTCRVTCKRGRKAFVSLLKWDQRTRE